MTIVISIFLIVVACMVIWRASNGFDFASEYLGRNLSEGVKGATINAIGSSMPELLTTFFFLLILKDRDGFAGGIGTTAGSAIFNGMIIPAVVILSAVGYGVIKHVKVSRKVIWRDGMGLLLCEAVLIYIIGGDTLYWWHGLILMFLYVGYVVFMLANMKRKPVVEIWQEELPEYKGSWFRGAITLDLQRLLIGHRKMQTGSAWLLLCVAMLVIGAACAVLVHSCEALGAALNIPIYFVAVIIASAATSIPDTILSMKDARKGNYDDAVSNALGSNIFDVCFALGLPLFVFTIIWGPISMSAGTVENIGELRVLLFGFTLLAFLIYVAKKRMGWVSAILLIGLYLCFATFIFGKALGWSWIHEVALVVQKAGSFIDSARFW